MSMIPVKGIPAGAPIIDPAAVFTPPVIGPHDSDHLWLAHSQIGFSDVAGLPDMVGSMDMVNGSKTWNVTEDSPWVEVTSVSEIPTVSTTEAEVRDDRTVLIVASLDGRGSGGQVRLPGYVLTLSGGGKVAGNGTGSFSQWYRGSDALTVFVYRMSATGAHRWINREKDPQMVAITGAQASRSNRWSFGSGGSAYSDKLACLKSWPRVLSDDEVAKASADAMKLFGITG